jgi:predicted PhzF superfamily epimerase YddE/YHI9
MRIPIFHIDAFATRPFAGNPAAVMPMQAFLPDGGTAGHRAAGDGDFDFVSRYFAPAKGVPEDPVTGGTHCALTPYWAKRLNKSQFRALQVSRRGGEINCRLAGDRVELQGSCVFYLEGQVEI